MTIRPIASADISEANLADLQTVSTETNMALALFVSGQTTLKLPRPALEAMARLLRLFTEEEVPVALPEEELSTGQRLRAENRIQDNPEILASLGYIGTLPPIPAELLEECASTRGTVVLRFKTTVLDIREKLNEAHGEQRERLGLNRIDDRTLATKNEEPAWINVPNTVREDTLGLSKVEAKKYIPGSQTCDPMDTVLMLGYNNLRAGQQMPGFKDSWTFTSKDNTIVGSDENGISVIVCDGCDADGDFEVGLAPRLAPESKKSLITPKLVYGSQQ